METWFRVMRSLSWAVVIFPSMFCFTRLSQGFNNMKPYALSQIAEQIIRVIWMLLATFFIMRIGTGDYDCQLFNRRLPLSLVCWLVTGAFLLPLEGVGKLKSLFGKQAVHPISIQLQLLLRHLRKPSPSLSLVSGSAFSSWLTNGPSSVLWRSLQAIVTVSFRFSMLICLQAQ